MELNQWDNNTSISAHGEAQCPLISSSPSTHRPSVNIFFHPFKCSRSPCLGERIATAKGGTSSTVFCLRSLHLFCWDEQTMQAVPPWWSQKALPFGNICSFIDLELVHHSGISCPYLQAEIKGRINNQGNEIRSQQLLNIWSILGYKWAY